jgi:hypothetical protein
MLVGDVPWEWVPSSIVFLLREYEVLRICFPELTNVLFLLQYVYLLLQEAENYERIRS